MAGGKGRVKTLSFKVLLAGRLKKKRTKKQRRTIRFNDFIPAWPPIENTQNGKWEVYMYHAFDAMVLEFISDLMGCNIESNCHPWIGVNHPKDHPKCDWRDHVEYDSSGEENEGQREWEDKAVYEGGWVFEREDGQRQIKRMLEYTFEDAARPWPSGEFKDYYGMIAPIACAFVHQTGWTTKLREFRVNSGVWMEMVKSMMGEFCNTQEMKEIIFNKANSSFDNVDATGDEFWRGFERSNKQQHGRQFLLTLEFYSKKICDLVLELEETYDGCPSPVDVVLSRRLWEVLVIDWIGETRDEEAYLFLYETPGDFFYYKDFMVEENYQRARDLWDGKCENNF